MAGHLVVLSGGLDSTVCMALASRDDVVVALTFDYGQRHRIELERARAVAAYYGAEQVLVSIDASRWGGSALTDPAIEVPPAAAPTTRAPSEGSDETATSIPVTYVPARNSIFLAVALGVAEARDLDSVYLGINALDYSGYPDCRPEFVEAFRRVAEIGQRRGIEGRPVDIRTPLVNLRKSEIARLGAELHAPLELTWSCYNEGPAPCGQCDACALRAAGFADAGLLDPALSA